MVSIRPEALSLLDGKEPRENSFDVTVLNAEYLGELSEAIAGDAAGGEVRFYQLNPRAPLEKGESRRLSVEPEDVVCMKP